MLVVDGYNLIFQRMGERQLDWEDRREELISELSEYALLRKLQVSPDSMVSIGLGICTAAFVDAKETQAPTLVCLLRYNLSDFQQKYGKDEIC